MTDKEIVTDGDIARLASIVSNRDMAIIALRYFNVSHDIIENMLDYHADPMAFNRLVLRDWRNRGLGNKQVQCITSNLTMYQLRLHHDGRISNSDWSVVFMVVCAKFCYFSHNF